jgi:O-antigen/teichoic acid export membrane protein
MTTEEDETRSATESELSTLVSSAALVLVGSLFGSFSKLLEQVIVARLLTPAAYGEVSVAIAVMSFSVTLSLVGLNQGMPRFMARYDNPRDIRGTWITGLLISVLVATVLALALLAGGDILMERLFEESTPQALLVLFVAAIPFVAGQGLGIGALRGFENTIYRTYARDLLYNGLRLATLVVLLLAGLGVLAAGYAYLIAGATAFVVSHLFLNRLLSLRGEVTIRARELVRFSAPLVVASAVSKLLSQADTLMLTYFLDSESVGLYNAAYPLAAGLPVILASFGFLYLPLTSRLDADGKREEIDEVHKLTTKWIFIAGFPVLLVFVAFPRDAIAIVFGGEYVEAGAALAVLAVGFFTSAAVGRCQDALSAFGYTGYILAVNTLAAVANIVLNLVLIPAYGVIGAAVASALSFVALNGVAFLVLWRLTGITPFSRHTMKTFIVLPVGLFPPTIALSQVFSLSLFTLPVFGVLAGLAVIAIVAVTGCLQPEDEVPVEVVERRLGVRVPFIRRYIPTENRES